MERLSQHHQCITFDHPGMGRSPPAAEHSVMHIAAQVVALLDELGLPSTHFVGH
jgi:pimeloyl-ACP methyl ester carboxylesterase